MSEEKWKQIERNLAEQESFVQTIIQQREKRNRPQNNANVDNILSTSIQKAKQKITQIESRSQAPRLDRSTQNLGLSREKKDRNSQESSAIAGAMKKLQDKISALEKEKKQIQLKLGEAKAREQEFVEKIDTQNRLLEEGKRKIKNLQSSMKNDKAWIQELEAKIEKLEQELQEKRASSKHEQFQRKLSNSQMMYRAQEQQLKSTLMENQTKDRKIMELQNALKQQQIKITEQVNVCKSLIKQLQHQNGSLKQKIQQKQGLIENLVAEVKKQENCLETSTQRLNRSKFRNFQNMEQKQSMLISSRSRRKIMSPNVRNEGLKEEIEEMKEKYEELFLSYKILDEKYRQEKNETKNFRTKFWQIKEIMKEIIDKIQTLPNGVTSQLKYLIIKANKIQAFSASYYVSTPTKSGRKNSFANSTSRSSSKSKKKSLRLGLDELNQSSRSYIFRQIRSKSKKSSMSKSKLKASVSKEAKHKQKQVILSQKAMKNSQITALEGEIQQIRKKYKEIASQCREGAQVNEEVREALNSIAVMLREKSEELTKLKKKNEGGKF